MPRIQAYRTTQLHSAPNEQVLILLLERALRDQDEAIDAMERGARLTWVAQLNHCRAIFVELQSALDHAVAPELTRNLHQVYAWVLHQLARAAKDGNLEVLQAVRRVTVTLHEAWTTTVARAADETEPALAESA